MTTLADFIRDNSVHRHREGFSVTVAPFQMNHSYTDVLVTMRFGNNQSRAGCLTQETDPKTILAILDNSIARSLSLREPTPQEKTQNAPGSVRPFGRRSRVSEGPRKATTGQPKATPNPYAAKLTPELVQQIKHLAKTESKAAISRQLKIGRKAVHNALGDPKWRAVE